MESSQTFNRAQRQEAHHARAASLWLAENEKFQLTTVPAKPVIRLAVSGVKQVCLSGCGAVVIPAVIFSAECVPANLEHFSKHAASVAQRTDASAFAVGPCHRNLHCLEPELFGQVKQFRIKAPALDLLQRENYPSRPAGKGLKSALCVFELEAQRKAQHEIENPPEELAVERLAFSL